MKVDYFHPALLPSSVHLSERFALLLCVCARGFFFYIPFALTLNDRFFGVFFRDLHLLCPLRYLRTRASTAAHSYSV